MPFLLRSIDEDFSQTAKDLFWILLLVGARKTNTLQMRWEQINWEHQIWRIPDSKNGETLLLPLVDRAIEILKRRKENSNSEWVFPSEKNPVGHFVNVKRAWRRTLQSATIHMWASDEKLRLLVEQCRDDVHEEDWIGMWFRLIKKKAQTQNLILPIGLMDIHLHDIRRTFGSYQAINGASRTIIGKSLGHKSHHSTQVYARLNLDPVRASIQQATETMVNTLSNSAA